MINHKGEAYIMNTPNKLTILRVILVPFFILFLLVDSIPFSAIFALAIFIIASVTDAVDGYLARKYNMITDFGKFLDPLADKVLVISAMVCFIEQGYSSAVPVIIIIAREFMVTSIRLIAASGSGKVIAAGILGKIKTAISMVAVVGILVLNIIVGYSVLSFETASVISNILMWICAVITIISGLDVLFKNKSLVNTAK